MYIHKMNISFKHWLVIQQVNDNISLQKKIVYNFIILIHKNIIIIVKFNK